MTEVQPALCFHENDNEHPASLFRQAFDSVLGEGIDRPGDLAVTANGTPNNTVKVASGGCWVAGDTAARQGKYWCYNDAQVTLTVAASPSAIRYDLVIAEVLDSETGDAAEGDAEWSLRIEQGTAGAGTPAIPDNALLLAVVKVDVGGSAVIETGDITDKRRQALPKPGRSWEDTNYDSVFIPAGSTYQYATLTLVTDGPMRARLEGWATVDVLSGGKAVLNFEVRKDGAAYAVPVRPYVECPTSTVVGLSTLSMASLVDLDGAATWEVRLAVRNDGSGTTVRVWGSSVIVDERSKPLSAEVS